MLYLLGYDAGKFVSSSEVVRNGEAKTIDKKEGCDCKVSLLQPLQPISD